MQPLQTPRELQPDMYPHFMEREKSKTFISKSILGLIYDKATQYQMEDPSNKGIAEMCMLWQLKNSETIYFEFHNFV